MIAPALRRLARLNESKRLEPYEPFMVGGPLLTILFWCIFAIFVVAVWLSPVMPFGDYNYHMALAAFLRRMVSPAAPERQLYETNLLSYNAFFQIVVAAVAFVMPVARAGQVVYCAFWLGLSLAVLKLLRALKQPTERAFILFPLFLAVPAAWGFTNYCCSIALHIYALARVVGRPRHGVPIKYDVITGIVALLGILAHLFGSGVMYTLILIALIVRTFRDPAPFVVRYLRTLREGLPFLPPIATAAAIYLHQRQYKNPDPDYLGEISATNKLKYFLTYGWDFYADKSDHVRLRWALILVALCFLFRAARAHEPYPSMKGWFFAASGVLYLVMPEGFWHVAVLFQRLPWIFVLFTVIAVPRAVKWVEKAAAFGLAIIGFKAAFAFLEVRRAQLPDLRDMTRVIAESPPHRRMSVHMPYTKLAGQMYSWAGHLGPYYCMQKGLECAVNYATKPSAPVHYRRESMPAVQPDAGAQGGQPYSPHAAYAKRFDLVLVRTLDPNPARAMWGDRAGEVDLVSHHGNWWMFDARRYFHNP